MKDNGRLILMSSLSAQRVCFYPFIYIVYNLFHQRLQGFPGHSIYAASKAAIQGMVRCLAYDFGPRNITVNCIAPGGIKTDMYGMCTIMF